jgi:hypothetical protein
MLVARSVLSTASFSPITNNRIIAHYFYNPARKASRALLAAAGDRVAAPFPASTATARQKTTVDGRSPLRPWEERAGSFGGTRGSLGPAIGIPRGGKRGAADQRLIRDAARRVLSGIRRYPLATRSARAAGGARNRKSGRGDRRTAHSASGQARQRAKPWWRRLVG